MHVLYMWLESLRWPNYVLGEGRKRRRPVLQLSVNNKLLTILQKKWRTCCNLQYNALPPVPGLESRTQSSILSSFIAFYRYFITILHLLALFMDMKPDTTNCVYRILIPDLDNEYWDIKVANCGIVFPVTLPIAPHPNPIEKKLKLLLSCDPM